MPDQTEARPTRKWRRWPWIFGGLLLVLIAIAVPVSWSLWVAHSISRRLEQAIAAADRDDPNWRLKDILTHRRVVPRDQNSALVARRVYEQLPASWPPSTGRLPFQPVEPGTDLGEVMERLNTTPSNVRLDDPSVELLRKELKTHEHAITLARTLADYRWGTHELKAGQTIMNRLMDETARTRLIARVLAADASVRAHDGDLDGAIGSCRAILGLSRSIGDEPFLLSALTRVTIGCVATQYSRRVLGQGEPSDEELAKLQADLETERNDPMLLRGIKGDCAALFETLRRTGDGELISDVLNDPGSLALSDPNSPRSWVSPSQRLSFQKQQAIWLEWMNQIVAITKSPSHEQVAKVERWKAEIELVKVKESLPLMTTPPYDSTITANLRYQGELGSMILLIAAERHRRKTGKWPESLDALDPSILPVQPLDPLTGHPFLMRYEKSRIVMYSVGLNLLDEAGSYEPRQWMSGHDDDVGSEGWDADRRKRPAQ